jgi:hypothetical protein
MTINELNFMPKILSIQINSLNIFKLNLKIK